MLVVLLEFAAVWSTIAQNQVYVTPDNGHSCPSGSTCHNLSYYISQPHTYFTSNTTIIFMSGEHQLNRQEPVIVVGADNLTLEGRGDWIEGPEENVMLSTAIIRCTSGNGGVAFMDSLSITIRRLSLLTCVISYIRRLSLIITVFLCTWSASVFIEPTLHQLDFFFRNLFMETCFFFFDMRPEISATVDWGSIIIL